MAPEVQPYGFSLILSIFTEIRTILPLARQYLHESGHGEMALQSPVHRPQTLRQAKRAYRKSSSKPKLSASELAVIERRAILQERADKIRKREAKRKANTRKKEEKKGRERESLLKQSREVPKEGLCKLGPHQLDLTRFLPIGETSCEQVLLDKKSHQSEGKAVTNEKQEGKDDPDEPVTKISMPPPPRSPLKEISTNSFGKPAPLSTKSEAVIPMTDIVDDLFVSNTQIEREIAPIPQEIRPYAIDPHQIPIPEVSKPRVSETELILAQILTQDLDCGSVLTQVQPTKNIQPTLIRSIVTPQEESFQTLQRCTDAPSQQNSEASQLLESICTQDLDLGDLSQSSAPETTAPLPPKSTSSNYSDEFSDHDLECLANEIELPSSSKGSDETQSTHFSGD